MQRMKDADLNNLSVKFAGDYVEKRFRNGSMIEKNLVLNVIAHGYYMGAREAEKRSPKSKWSLFKLFHRTETDAMKKDDWLSKESRKAGIYYCMQKKYERTTVEEIALIRATLGVGFKNGYKERESLT